MFIDIFYSEDLNTRINASNNMTKLLLVYIIDIKMTTFDKTLLKI